jgi:hypothetical protein
LRDHGKAAALMVALSANIFVWRAIAEIRLTTLPISNDDVRRPSELRVASSVAAAAFSARASASLTRRPVSPEVRASSSAASAN